MFDEARNRIATRLRALATLPVPELAPVRFARRAAEELAARIETARPHLPEKPPQRPHGRRGQRIDVAELVRRLDSAVPMLIYDIREPIETQRGSVPGARALPIQDLLVRLHETRAAARPVVLVCGDGSRSDYASMHLIGDGIEPVYVLEGGFDAWLAAGQPVVTPLPEKHP